MAARGAAVSQVPGTAILRIVEVPGTYTARRARKDRRKSAGARRDAVNWRRAALSLPG